MGHARGHLQNDKLPGRAANLDRAVSTRIADLKSKGLRQNTLIALGTEFGRTPRINQNGGRDHHPGAFSGFFAGGGIKGGRFYGKSDKDGFSAEEDDITVGDVNATIGHALGLPSTQEFFSKSGRPFKIAHDGKPILNLLTKRGAGYHKTSSANKQTAGHRINDDQRSEKSQNEFNRS